MNAWFLRNLIFHVNNGYCCSRKRGSVRSRHYGRCAVEFVGKSVYFTNKTMKNKCLLVQSAQWWWKAVNSMTTYHIIHLKCQSTCIAVVYFQLFQFGEMSHSIYVPVNCCNLDGKYPINWLFGVIDTTTTFHN